MFGCKIRSSKRCKGISTLLGASLMIILLLTGFSVVFWEITQIDALQDLVNKKGEEELKRAKENIEITEVRVNFDRINCSVTNKGTAAVHLVDLILMEYNLTDPFWQTIYSIDYTLNPYATTNNIGQNLTMYIYANRTYSVRVVTERGSFANAIYVPLPPEETEIGPSTFTFDYLSFNYTTTSDGNYYESHSRPAWNMVGGRDDILFWLKLTNKGSQGINISVSTYIMVVQPRSDSGEDEFYFYIVDNSSDSGNVNAYTTWQVIPPNLTDPDTGTTAILKLGAKRSGETELQRFPMPVKSYNNERRFFYNTFIALFWRWTGINQTYGVLVPFASQRVDPYEFLDTPEWVNPVDRPISGYIRVYHKFEITSYRFRDSDVAVEVQLISGPGTMSYSDGPWHYNVYYGDYYWRRPSIRVYYDTVPGTYVFETTATSYYYGIETKLVRRITLVVY